MTSDIMSGMVSDMARNSMIPLIDRIMDGALVAKLTEWREAGDSYDTIAAQLHAESGYLVTGSTIRRWCAELSVEEPVAS